MGPKIYSQIHEIECERAFCRASANEETKEDMVEERGLGEISIQGDQTRNVI